MTNGLHSLHAMPHFVVVWFPPAAEQEADSQFPPVSSFAWLAADLYFVCAQIKQTERDVNLGQSQTKCFLMFSVRFLAGIFFFSSDLTLLHGLLLRQVSALYVASCFSLNQEEIWAFSEHEDVKCALNFSWRVRIDFHRHELARTGLWLVHNEKCLRTE